MPSAASADDIAIVIAQCPDRRTALQRLYGGPREMALLVSAALSNFVLLMVDRRRGYQEGPVPIGSLAQ